MTTLEVITGTKKLNVLSLFVPILLVFLVLRVVVIILSGYEFGEVLIIRAVVSDIGIAAVMALLISLIPVRILQVVLGILVCILGSANVEHILANGTHMDVTFEASQTKNTE